MSKKLLTFGDIEIEKNTFYSYKTLIFLRYVDIEKVLYLKRFLLVKKIINILLVTLKMIIKLNHYV